MGLLYLYLLAGFGISDVKLIVLSVVTQTVRQLLTPGFVMFTGI